MCGLMRPAVCESVRGQDKLQGSRSIGEVDVGECGQEKMHSEVRGEGWEMLGWISPETRGIGTLWSGKRLGCRCGRQWQGGREKIEGYLSGFNGLYNVRPDIKRWSLMTSASSITKLVNTDVCEVEVLQAAQEPSQSCSTQALIEKGAWPHCVLRKPCCQVLFKLRVLALSTVTKRGRLLISESNKQIIPNSTIQRFNTLRAAVSYHRHSI